MLKLLAQKLSTLSLPLAKPTRGSLAVWQYASTLHCFSTMTSVPADRLTLSPSRFATLEANLGNKIAGEFQLRPPPNLNELLQRSRAGLSAHLNIHV
jgi:hypothetical protein